MGIFGAKFRALLGQRDRPETETQIGERMQHRIVDRALGKLRTADDVEREIAKELTRLEDELGVGLVVGQFMRGIDRVDLVLRRRILVFPRHIPGMHDRIDDHHIVDHGSRFRL